MAVHCRFFLLLTVLNGIDKLAVRGLRNDRNSQKEKFTKLLDGRSTDSSEADKVAWAFISCKVHSLAVWAFVAVQFGDHCHRAVARPWSELKLNGT